MKLLNNTFIGLKSDFITIHQGSEVNIENNIIERTNTSWLKSNLDGDLELSIKTDRIKHTLSFLSKSDGRYVCEIQNRDFDLKFNFMVLTDDSQGYSVSFRNAARTIGKIQELIQFNEDKNETIQCEFIRDANEDIQITLKIIVYVLGSLLLATILFLGISKYLEKAQISFNFKFLKDKHTELSQPFVSI